MLLGLCLLGLTGMLVNAGLSLARQDQWTGVAIIGTILVMLLGVALVSVIQSRRRR